MFILTFEKRLGLGLCNGNILHAAKPLILCLLCPTHLCTFGYQLANLVLKTEEPG